MSGKKELPNYYAYTAVFEEDEDGWIVRFPDLNRCATNADTLEETIIQAHNILEDYMAILERDGKPIPEPIPYEAVKIKAGAVAQRIVVPMDGARRRWENRSVNRTVTLPAWLDEKGREANLNFSQLLQSAVARALQL
ncbi:MAG: type II toxin-antitoxin system HicB family antitoxin [Synergistaceae bacterium]|nr:type II toxin-antitoxin system HicB family antitoxin [Synergistaceae bacterium]